MHPPPWDMSPAVAVDAVEDSFDIALLAPESCCRMVVASAVPPFPVVLRTPGRGCPRATRRWIRHQGHFHLRTRVLGHLDRPAINQYGPTRANSIVDILG